jgi:hypothetical protein
MPAIVVTSLISTASDILKWVALSLGYSIALVYSGASLYLTIMTLKGEYKSWSFSVDR